MYCRMLVALVVATGVSTGSVAAQSVMALGAGRVLPRPFSDITSIQELPDGRALVTDGQERTVAVVEFGAGRVTAVSRDGSGPLEYRTPGRVFRWRGDSVAMYDPAQTRLLVFDHTGTPRRSIDLIQALAWVAEGQRPSRNDIRFADASGRLYAQSSIIPVVAVGQTPPDSGPVVRYDIEHRRADTLALVRLSGLVYRPNAGVSFGDMANPFRVQDAWSALPDGRVAFVRSVPYLVEWRDSTGRRVRGPAIQARPVPVTQADLTEIAEEGVVIGGRLTRIPVERLTNFPTSKPFFDHRTLVADPFKAAVWIQRFRASGDSVPVYDIFDSTGRLTSRVRVPAHSRVIGFGPEHVYLARTDADGLQRLERSPRVQ